MNLIDVFVDRSRATIILLLVTLLAGYIAYHQIPKESTPDVKVPIIYVMVSLEGISPEDAERLLIKPLESELRNIEGVKEMVSYAFEGSASVMLEFKAGFNSEKALSDVRNKVRDAEADLPADAKQPVVSEVNLSLFPVLNVVLTGEVPERTLIQYARDVRDRIESIPAILEAKIAGDREDSVEIIVKPEVIEAYGLSVQSLRQIVDSNNKLVAAGSIRSNSGEFSVKLPGLVESYEALLNFPVKISNDSVTRIRDIAEVRRTYKDATDVARVNGKPSIVLEVSKRTGENIINTVQQVKELVEQERLYWPEKIEVIYAKDESNNITEMVVDLENNIIIGIILVMLVVIMSVGPRSAFLISVSIPASFLAGILIFYISGMTLNIVVLFSLILTLGMVVDDAIVVSEYADRLMMSGVSPDRAFVDSAKRMLWPVITSTLVKIVVFMPLLFWPGIVGQFMKYMPITAIAILTNSLLFALFFQPTLGPMFGKPKEGEHVVDESMQAADTGEFDKLTGLSKKYYQLLVKVLDHPKKFVFQIFSLLAGVYTFFFLFGTGFEFFPKVEPESAVLMIKSPGNLSLTERDRLMQEVEEKIADMKEVKLFYTKAGNFSTSNQVPKDTIGTVFLEFGDWQKRRKADHVLQDVFARIGSVKGIEFEALQNKPGPPAKKPIEINISSRDIGENEKVADMMINFMNKSGGFKDMEDSRSSKAIEWQLIVDREKAAKHGIDMQTIGNTVRMATSGLKISSYRPLDTTDEVDILVRFDQNDRTISVLDDLKIIDFEGNAVPISNFIVKKPALKVDTLKRVDRDRVVTIKADVEAGNLVDNKVNSIKQWVAQNFSQNRNLNIKFKGEDQDQKEASEFLQSAFVITLFSMFIIMLIQFNNIYHTLIIMSAVFLATVGVILGLIVTWQPFGVVMCGVGIIALGGIVLNNNILFVDTYQHLREGGIEVREAIIRAGIQRLRPILLTAATAVLGLLPMVFGLTINFMDRYVTYDAPSSQWWRQLSASIAGGLTFATVLTLFFTPCLLLIGKRFDRYKD